jgi:hypothetical protein
MKKPPDNELRAAARVATKVAVLCRPYTSSGTVPFAHGVMRNFSNQGSYIESDLKFKSGTILIVRTVGCLPAPSPTDGYEQPRSICLGEIRWEQELTDVEERLYGMGLRYLD